MDDGQEFSEVDHAAADLYRAEWSVGSAAFVGPAGLVWIVTGTNGENRLHATGAMAVEAWRAALGQARAVGMLGRVRPWQVEP